MSDVIEKLKQAFDQEQLDQSPPVTASDLPLSYEAITDAWLTNVVCRGHPGARVTAHQLGAIDEGNTSRRRIFIQYNEPGIAAGLPTSVFCKASHHFSTRISLGVCGGLFGEVTFYNKIRPLLDLEAPIGVFANINPQTLNSIILLHDLGPGTEFCSMATEMTETRLKGQMSVLARLHSRFWPDVDRAEALAELPTWQEFWRRLSLIGFEKICAGGLMAAESVVPKRLFARRDEIWPATEASVTWHDTLPRTLLHSDVHLRNWYVTADNRMGLTDWQGICKGHWSRDVAYALATAMSVEKRRQFGDDLLRHYLAELKEFGGPVVSFDEALALCRQQLFTALAYWTVTMPSAELHSMQPVDQTLELIRRISAAIDDLDALDSFD